MPSGHVAFRRRLLDAVKAELMGPGSEPLGLPSEVEILSEDPLQRYSVGILYPQQLEREAEDVDSDNALADAAVDSDELLDAATTVINQYYPSAIGLSFYTTGLNSPCVVQVDGAQYGRVSDGWQRHHVAACLRIPSVTSQVPTRETFRVCDGLSLVCLRRPIVDSGITLFTLSLVNGFKASRKTADRCFFQVGIRVSPEDESVRFVDYQHGAIANADPDERSLNLLYRNRRVLGVGHGCAVSWDEEDSVLKTEIIPEYEVPMIKFDIDELLPHRHVMSMRYLSDLSATGVEELLTALNGFVQEYERWIEKKRLLAEELDECLRDTALANMRLCREAADRMRKGIDLLRVDPIVRHAFRLANRAMVMQRAHSVLQSRKRFPDDEAISWPDYANCSEDICGWRPFQLAFVLLNLRGISECKSPERSLVDLIWFPTGGGKTEAYLGITAFAVFLRRLRNPKDGKGTAVIMRYTLRLLTAQQFQRAATLICACEIIRKNMPTLLGTDPITIGLWIGHSSTPNNLAEAFEKLDGLVSGMELQSPFQVLSCPWCGTKMIREENRGEWGYRRGDNPRRLVVRCTDSTCPFHTELPISVVDEDIYRNPPTLVFGTVDKFALMPWRTEVGSIFGLDRGNPSPELIIQDELHLISGPLGTIVGLYETALEALCSAKGVTPKILASTATIRGASQQVRALFNREVRVFPPSALDAEESFYADEAPLSERHGRLYVGVMSAGRTQTTMKVRLLSAILQCVSEIQCDDTYKDPYWTLVGYFNTIRELGHCSTLVRDDIKDQVRRIAIRHGASYRVFSEAHELTGSNRHSIDIPRTLEKLQVSIPDRHVIDILLASNMISVGVDVDRLGLMVVNGQPKTTSEYIQATSRVGRKFPGLIFTLYDGARPRDRSHYERFSAYHQAFYRHVEPTSITPFSGPARDRALHAVLVTLVRHIVGLGKDGQASGFSDRLPGLQVIRDTVMKRVLDVMPEEATATAAHLERLVEAWAAFCRTDPDLTYANSQKPHLMFPAGKTKDKYWDTLQSMRNVDAPCNVRIVQSGGDRNAH